MTKNKPTISVVMSVFNGEKTLAEAIESILHQSCSDFEFLIVNDGSNDKSSEIIKGFNDQRIKVISHKNSIGLTKSLIDAIDLASGEYIARMDADDVSNIKRFENEIKYLNENQNVGLVGTWFEVINETGTVLAKHKPANKKKITGKNLVISNQFVHGSVMFRKNVYDKVGGYRSFYRYAQDYDLWLRISQISKISVIPKYLYKWRIHDEAISVDKRALQNKYAQIARASYKERMGGERESILRRDKKGKERIEKLLTVTEEDKAAGYLNWAWTLFFYNEYSGSYKKALTSLKFWPINFGAYFLALMSLGFRILPKNTAVMIKKFYNNL